jgi:NAD(P)-dependent dehydrogenase (short-subunit alcohol dehydrogenase family)
MTTAHHTTQPSLQNQHVLILGGSSGIGLATAQLATAQGAELTLAARNNDRLKQAGIILPLARLRHADLHAPESFAALLKDLPAIDHLLITAGDPGLPKLVDSQESDMRLTLQERLISPLLLIRDALPLLKPNASITLLSGQLASRPANSGALTAAAIAAVETLAPALSLELAPRRVNVVAPGYTDTALLARALGAQKQNVLEQMAERLPARRTGTPENLAQAIVFLMTNPYVSGEVLHVDGGGRWI